MSFKRKFITLLICFLSVITLITTADASSVIKGRGTNDPYPLQGILQYKVDCQGLSPVESVERIVTLLDIESNERYFQTGVVKKNSKLYEIPQNELEDFNISPTYNNTYCNIFTLDVLNILANSVGDEGYRISSRAVMANDLRKLFEKSPNWHEVSKSEAVEWSRKGFVVVLSYTENPHGHVALVKPTSTNDNIRLWNVGSVNSEDYEWTIKVNTKYFVKY